MGVLGRYTVAFASVPVVAGFVALTVSGAFAQSTCSCLAPASEAGSVIGRLTQVHGNVKMSQAGGYAGVKADAAVYAGARIMTGSQSSASLSVGADCALDIPANATVKVDPAQGGMCVSLNAPSTIVPVSIGPGLVPVLLGGGAVGGAAALILSLHNDDNSVSR